MKIREINYTNFLTTALNCVCNAYNIVYGTCFVLNVTLFTPMDSHIVNLYLVRIETLTGILGLAFLLPGLHNENFNINKI